MENFWKDKKVFLTGGSGFIGSHLLQKLVKLGADVTTTQHVKESPVCWGRYGVLPNFDVKDNMCFYSLLDSGYKPDVVFHLAATAIVLDAEVYPDETFGTNVIGTYNVLRAFPKSTIIVASTDKVYGRSKIPYTESTPLVGTHQIYEATKVAADVMAQAFFHRGQKVAITRACNIFGYDEESTRIIPHIIQSVRKNKVVHLRTSTDYVRDYLYVQDIVSGYLKLGEWRDWSDWAEWQSVAFNFGGHNLSVLDLMNHISEAMGLPIDYVVDGHSKGEIKVQSLDWRLAWDVLGWKPSPFSDGIKKTIDEYLCREV